MVRKSRAGQPRRADGVADAAWSRVELHEQLRRASKASCRSINAQAAFWIRIGMLGELNPGLSFQELAARELKAAGVCADLAGSAVA